MHILHKVMQRQMHTKVMVVITKKKKRNKKQIRIMNDD